MIYHVAVWETAIIAEMTSFLILCHKHLSLKEI